MRNQKWIAITLLLVLAVALILPSCTESTPTPTPTATATVKPTATPTPTPTFQPPPTLTASPTAAQRVFGYGGVYELTPNPQYGGIFRGSTTSQMTNFGYTPTMPGQMTAMVHGCLEGLLWHNGRTGEIGPWLIKSWEKDPNEKFLIFHTQQGVKFHDGTPFNADAVKFNIDLKQKENHGWLGTVTSTEVIDQYTCKLNTTNYNLTMWIQLAEVISSPTHLAKGKDFCQFTPIGTGPFKFKEFVRDVRLTYDRFDDYWGGKPYLDKLQVVFFADTVSQFAALLAGEVDVNPGIQFKDIETLKNKGFNLVSYPMVLTGLMPDTANPDSVFSDVRVLQAISCAIDRDGIAKELGYGYMNALNTIYPSSDPLYDPSVAVKYDPAKAKQLLKEAGHPDGIDITIDLIPYINQDLFVAMQGSLAEAGIRAKINNIDIATWSNFRSNGWKDVLLPYYGIFQAPYEYNLNRALDPGRKDYVSGQRPAGFDDLLAKLSNTTDAKVRAPLAAQMQKMVNDNVLIIPFLTYANIAAVNPRVKDAFVYAEHGTDYFFPDRTWIKD